MSTEPITIACEFIRESPMAVLIFDGNLETWIPKGQILERDDESITIPEWLAVEKDLI